MTSEPITDTHAGAPKTDRQHTARRQRSGDARPHGQTTSAPAPTMQILDARVMRGPSRWSRRPMVRLLVDLGVLEEFPSNAIPGFNGRLLKVLPGLVEHSD